MLSKRQYLAAMGIDVWSRRSVVAPEQVPAQESPVVPAAAAVVAAAPVSRPEMTKRPEEAVRHRADAPHFRLGLLHYVSVGVCVLMPDPDIRLPRRLCDDIARAVGGNVTAAGYQELTWPMLDTPGIDQSVNAAREVVTQKIKSLPPRVLVMGSALATYFSPLQGMTMMEPGRFGGQDFLLIPAPADIMSLPDIKRELMPVLLKWQ